jgi:hypothetical protein
MLVQLLLLSAAAAEFQSLLALEFVRGVSVTSGAPRVVAFQPTPLSNAVTGIAFRVFFCQGGADVFLTVGADKMPTPIVNQFQQLYVRGDIVAQTSAMGPGNALYNLALFYAASTMQTNGTVIVDVVAASTQAAIDERVPKPGGANGELRIKKKVDRTNTIAWTPTGVAGDSYQVWIATEALPTGDKNDGRNPDSACGAEAALTKRGEAQIGTTATDEMTFDVTDVMGVNTAVVVVTRAGGYKASYVSAYLTVQGGPQFTNIDGSAVMVTGTTGDNSNANAAAAAALAWVAGVFALVAVTN